VSHLQLPDNSEQHWRSGRFKGWTQTLVKEGDIKFQTLFRGDKREGENQLIPQNPSRQFAVTDTLHLLPG